MNHDATPPAEGADHFEREIAKIFHSWVDQKTREVLAEELRPGGLLAHAERPISRLSIDALVARFLAWPVPASVCPDGVPGQPGRTGTNLLSALEARAMLEYVLGPVSAAQG